MDIEILEQQLEGLEKKLEQLRADKDLFVKAQGLREQEEKARLDIISMKADHKKACDELAEAEKKRMEIVSPTLGTLNGKMDKILPEGSSMINFNSDGSCFIGWKLDNKIRPYAGLSGGEKAAFNGALCHALGAELVIIEAGEMDERRCSALIDQLTKFEGQVIVNTWCEDIAEFVNGLGGWKVEVLQNDRTK